MPYSEPCWLRRLTSGWKLCPQAWNLSPSVSLSDSSSAVSRPWFAQTVGMMTQTWHNQPVTNTTGIAIAIGMLRRDLMEN
eukprot:6183887-Pleurochrysis_carterae.AAC.3